jgi:hypothetical protein
MESLSMSELLPNTEVILSSDLLDDDLCLENMSALAFAVLDAYMTGYGWLDSPTKKDCRGVAAALRAAADTVVPEEPLYGGDQRWMFERDARQDCRKKLLAIADELEAQ